MNTVGSSVTHLGVELVDLSVLVAGDDKLSQRSPHSTGDLVLAAGSGQVGLVVFYRDRWREMLITATRQDFILCSLCMLNTATELQHPFLFNL